MALVPLLLGRVRRERRFIVGVLVIIPLSALMLSASRGGIISLGAELAFLILVLILKKTSGRHLFAGIVVLLVAFLTVSWLGVSQILSRFSSLQTLEGTEQACLDGAGGRILWTTLFRNGARNIAAGLSSV
jgi:hypothetical protein